MDRRANQLLKTSLIGTRAVANCNNSASIGVLRRGWVGSLGVEEERRPLRRPPNDDNSGWLTMLAVTAGAFLVRRKDLDRCRRAEKECIEARDRRILEFPISMSPNATSHHALIRAALPAVTVRWWLGLGASRSPESGPRGSRRVRGHGRSRHRRS
jgi:hypothetical protein